ncbi:MAG TPA: hypothetical protein VIY48_10105 [Candidatus Paceibacterota bacterium]
MTDETIFGTDDQKSEGTAGAVTLPDSVKDLIGPGKKYATVEKALESITHAQSHIAQLEAEARTLREKATGAVSQEELLRTVQELLAEERKAVTAADKTHVTSSLDENVLDDVLERKLADRERRRQEDANVTAVKAAMQEKYGEKAEEMYKAKATELGVGISFLNDVVAKSPEAASRLLGLEPKKQDSGVAHTRGSVNTSALHNREQAPPEHKSIMLGARTSDIVNEWRRHDPTKKE